MTDNTEIQGMDPALDTCERPDRREVLEKLKLIAAYTPPAMLTLMLSQRASAFSTPPAPPGGF